VGSNQSDQKHGTWASSAEFAHFDQVEKPEYRLAEVADAPEDFDEEFQIATLDLGRYLHGNETDREAFSVELGAAMRDIGFVILDGHGVDPGLFDEADSWVEQLFVETSLDEKMRFRAERQGAVSEGYFPIRETSNIHPDLVEGWVFGRRAFDLDGDPDFDAAGFWPQPELEPCFRRWVLAGTALFQPIMQAILQSLGCDRHLFDDRLDQPLLGQRLNYYPPVNDVGVGRLLGHEDVDLFTLLPAASVDGLQALHRNGKWVRVNAPRGSIIMNTGDYVQRVSNDVLPSTTHRVSVPSDPALAAVTRVSTPLAAYLDPNSMLEVLPGLGEPRYDPIRVLPFHTRSTAKFYGADYAVE